MASSIASYVLRSGRVISPFGDAPGETRVLNRSLRERQTEACEQNLVRAPVEIESVEEATETPCIVFADYTYFTRALLEDFLGQARGQGASAVCAMPPSVFLEATSSLQDLRWIPDEKGAAAYDLWYLADPVSSAESLQELPHLAVDPKEKVEEPRLPPQFVNKATPTRVSITSRQVMHVTHWALVHRVNLAAFVATLRDLWDRRPVYIILRFLVDKLIGRFRRVRFSRVGKGCEIHPTAVVEGSWLGKGVKVGAGAIIQGSVVGDDTIVEEGSILELSVVGHRCWISRKSVLFMTVLYDEVFCGHRLTQSCLLGRHSCTTGGGFIIDMNFHGSVRVMKDGKAVDAGSNFLGACLGHDVVMGTGIWIQAGREVPSGAFLIRDPDHVLSRIPEELEEGMPMVHRKGGLEPLG